MANQRWIVPKVNAAGQADYRWSSDGEAICSRSFVSDAFTNARERCGKNRKTGAKKLRGAASPADGLLWSLRDLGKEIT